VANRPTAEFGSGGAHGVTPSPAAFIIPARRARLLQPVANDNTPPLSRRLLRYGLLALIAVAVSFLALA
jgi:hypothetical protein